MTALSDLLNNLNRQDLSSRQIATEAEKRGHKLNFATASRYLRGDHPAKPSAPVLAAFAAVFGTDVNKIREAAGQAASHDRFELPAEADVLDPDERRAITELVRVMARQKKAGEGNADSPTPMKQAGGKPATGEDDGLGAFGGRARGDLDHEDLNDGAGDNVRKLRETPLFTPPPPAEETAALYGPNRGRQAKEEQDRDAEGSQDPEDDEE